MKNIVTFTNTETGEVELVAECNERIKFDYSQDKGVIGILKGGLETRINSKELNFNKLNKGKSFDFEIEKNKHYEATIVYNSILDDDREGSKYYTLYRAYELNGSVNIGYYIKFNWSRGWDQWGYYYELNKDELIEFVKDNDNGHIFIEGIKNYLGI